MKQFYKVDFKHLEENEDKEGKITQRAASGTILVRASSCAEAETIANNKKGNLLDFTVTSVSKTNFSLVTDGKDISITVDE